MVITIVGCDLGDRGVTGASRGAPGASWGLLEPPGASWGLLGSKVFKCPKNRTFLSTVCLGSSWGLLGSSWAFLGPLRTPVCVFVCLSVCLPLGCRHKLDSALRQSFFNASMPFIHRRRLRFEAKPLYCNMRREGWVGMMQIVLHAPRVTFDPTPPHPTPHHPTPPNCSAAILAQEVCSFWP